MIHQTKKHGFLGVSLGQTDLEFIVEKILNRSDPGAIGEAPKVGDWETRGRRGRAGQETTARTSLRGAWFRPRHG